MSRGQGTARGLIAWVLMLLGAICLLADISRLNMTGVAVAGVVLLAIALWILGVFRRAFGAAPTTDRQEDQ